MTRRRVRIAEQARADLRSITSHTRRRWGEAQVAVYRDNFEKAFRRIADNAAIGQVWPDTDSSYRRWPCGRHLIFYRSDESGGIVVRILHERMDARHRMGLNEAPAAYAP